MRKIINKEFHLFFKIWLEGSCYTQLDILLTLVTFFVINFYLEWKKSLTGKAKVLMAKLKLLRIIC